MFFLEEAAPESRPCREPTMYGLSSVKRFSSFVAQQDTCDRHWNPPRSPPQTETKSHQLSHRDESPRWVSVTGFFKTHLLWREHTEEMELDIRRARCRDETLTLSFENWKDQNHKVHALRLAFILSRSVGQELVCLSVSKGSHVLVTWTFLSSSLSSNKQETV